MAKAKVIIKILNAHHQNTSLKHYLPLHEKMVSEIHRTVKEIFDELGGVALIKSSGAIIALALAKLKGSTSRVPNPFCHLFRVV